MPDPVVEFFTEKEWYDQDEISMNKRLAVREFYEWLQNRPTQRAADCFYCEENKPLANVVICQDCVDELTHSG